MKVVFVHMGDSSSRMIEIPSHSRTGDSLSSWFSCYHKAAVKYRKVSPCVSSPRFITIMFHQHRFTMFHHHVTSPFHRWRFSAGLNKTASAPVGPAWRIGSAAWCHTDAAGASLAAGCGSLGIAGRLRAKGMGNWLVFSNIFYFHT